MNNAAVLRFVLSCIWMLAPLLAGEAAFGEEPAEPKLIRPVLFAGGVASGDGKTGFLHTEAGLEAVDLATGNTRWSTALSTLVLLAEGDCVFLVRRTAAGFTVVTLDMATGKLVRESAATAIPASVGADCRLHAEAVLPEKGGLLVRWSAVENYDGGAPKKIATETGVLRMDLATGKTTPADAKEFPERPRGTPIQAEVGGVRLFLNQRSTMDGQITICFRTLVAKDAAGRVLWERALRTQKVMPPKP